MVLEGTLTFLYLGISPRKARERSARTIRNFLVGFFMLVFGISIPLYFYSTEVWYDASYQANQSEILQTWLKKNELIIEHVRIDEERRIVFLGLLGPNPPLSVETLHSEMDKRQRDKTGENAKPFSIEVLWTQTARFSWPPELTLQSDKRKLHQDHSVAIQGYSWYWIGTQYADGDWLRPEHRQAYVLNSKAKNSLSIATHCSRGSGSYELNQEEISTRLDVKIDEACDTAKIDNRFIIDLGHVINVQVEGDHLSLRLDSDVGVMHFTSNKPE